MEIVKILRNNGKQFVTLPKSCEFQEEEVFINRIGELVMIVPKKNPLAGVSASLDIFTDDFMKEGRKDLQPEERELL